jgi:hypothetical protein
VTIDTAAQYAEDCAFQSAIVHVRIVYPGGDALIANDHIGQLEHIGPAAQIAVLAGEPESRFGVRARDRDWFGHSRS